jgi:uncharacterized protein
VVRLGGAGLLGGSVGAALLLVLPPEAFRQIVPFLVLFAAGITAIQPSLTDRLEHIRSRPAHDNPLVVLAVFLTAIYGGYFGAGLGIMLLAILGLFSPLSLDRLNAVKQVLALAVNVSAAAFLAVSGAARWDLVAVMAPASLIGGNLGGRLVRVIPAAVLRPVIVTLGVAVAVVYLVR